MRTRTVAVMVLLCGFSGTLSVNVSSQFGQWPQLVAILFVGFGALQIRHLGAPRFVRATIVAFLLLALLATVVGFFNGGAEIALRGFTGICAGIGAILTTAAVCRSDDLETRRANQRAVGTAVLLVAVFTSLWALRQSFFGFTSRELQVISEQFSTYLVGAQIRSSGMFIVNQEFGLFAATMVPALLVLAMQLPQRRQRWIYGAAFALLVVALLVSLFRTAIVGAAAGVVLALVLFSPGKQVVARLAGALVVGALIVGGSTWFLSQSTDPRAIAAVARISTLLAVEEDGSFNARTDRVWARAVDLMVEHPFGLGAGSAGPVSQRFAHLAPAGNVTTDNGYLMIGVQLGWLGLVVFVSMLVGLFLWLVRSRDPWARASAMALVALMVAMITVGLWSLLAPILIVGALVGVGAAGATQDDSERRRQPKSRAARRIGRVAPA